MFTSYIVSCSLDSQPPTFSNAPISLRDYLGLKRQIIVMGARDPVDHAEISHNKLNALNIRTSRGVMQVCFWHTYSDNNILNIKLSLLVGRKKIRSIQSIKYTRHTNCYG